MSDSSTIYVRRIPCLLSRHRFRSPDDRLPPVEMVAEGPEAALGTLQRDLRTDARRRRGPVEGLAIEPGTSVKNLPDATSQRRSGSLSVKLPWVMSDER